MAVPVGDKRAPATAPHAEAEGKPQKQKQKQKLFADEDAPGRAAPNRREGALSRTPSCDNGSQEEGEHLEACGTVVHAQQQHPHPAAPRAKSLWQTLANAIQLLAARDPHAGAATLTGWTPLHQAAYYGRATSAQRLLAVGAPLHSRDKEGNTPLHLACLSRQLPAIKVFLAAGADMDVPNELGQSPLSLCTSLEAKQLLNEERARREQQQQQRWGSSLEREMLPGDEEERGALDRPSAFCWQPSSRRHASCDYASHHGGGIAGGQQASGLSGAAAGGQSLRCRRASLPLEQASDASSAPVAAAVAAAAAARALLLHTSATPSRPRGSALAPGGSRALSLRSLRTCPSQLPRPWLEEAGPGSGSLLVSGSTASDIDSGSSGSSGSVSGLASDLTGSTEVDNTCVLESGSPRKWATYCDVLQPCKQYASTQMASAAAACGVADTKRSPERVPSRRVSRIEPEDLDPCASVFKLKHSPSASRRKSFDAPFPIPAPGSPSSRFASAFTPAGVSPRACQRQSFDVVATITVATAHGSQHNIPHAGPTDRAISTHCSVSLFKEVTAVAAVGKGVTAITAAGEAGCRSAEPMRGGPFLASGRSKSAKGLQLGSPLPPCCTV